MDVIVLGGQRFTVDRARVADIPALVALLADDPLGSDRETHSLAAYEHAFAVVARDPNQYLAAVRAMGGELIATMQLTLIHGLSRGAMLRLQIEAVRVAEQFRGFGLGSALFAWAHDYGRRHGAGLAQLTTDMKRSDAHRFYARLGYQATHQGLKLDL